MILLTNMACIKLVACCSKCPINNYRISSHLSAIDYLFVIFYDFQAVGASQDVEETIKELKKIPGFNAYLILNNDGENSGTISLVSSTQGQFFSLLDCHVQGVVYCTNMSSLL